MVCTSVFLISNGSKYVVLKKEWKGHEKRWIATAYEKVGKSPSGFGQSIGVTENLTVERTDPLYSLNEDSIENLSLSSANVKNLYSISAQGHVGLSNLQGRKILHFIRPK